ncbi:hypothetical protein QBZ16_005251 [Prototheca wickerhamii]|uniref:Agmatine deiminase n=1 Tax=Prototheca wickerhamii TaxID=3111 RepID=A0AAD9IG52_PROWI|nr:hypothetical protein QBZ16_005251 [Prototheca wickerhamii]
MAIFLEVARAIAEFEPVTFAADPDLVEDVQSRVAAAGPTVHPIDVRPIALNDSWTRDNGPMFVVRDGAAGREVAGVDWEFNAWGGLYDDFSLDKLVASRICESQGIPVIKKDMVLEGGSVHLDGEGTLLTTEECLCNPNRNPSMTKEEIEAELRATLGVSKIIWLPRGLAADTDTNGHVDNIACFARPGVVLLSWTDDEADEQHARSVEALRVLEAAQDARGRQLSVIKLPLSKPMHYTAEEVQGLEGVSDDDEMARRAGSRLAGSYVNFYICNGGIVMPGWGDAEADARAKAVLEESFPERKVVQLMTREVLLGGGNVHCITQQQPVGAPAQQLAALYPIIFPVALAVAAVGYSLGRHLLTNPEVFPGKKARAEQYSEEELVARGKGYANSLFRAAQEGHGLKGIFGDVPKN